MSEVNGHSKNGSKNGWKNLKLKEICLDKEGLRRGPFGSAIKKEFFVPDGYKVYEQANAIYDDVERGRYFISESKYKELENFGVKEGDFIVSCSGTLGRISQIPKGAKAGVINQALLRIRLKNGIVLNKYFLYYFRSSFFQRKIFEESQGTAMSNLIGIKDFKEIEVPIPSIEEQENLVCKIEELFSESDKSIEQLKTAQQQLKVYRQSVLKWAFEGKLTNQNIQDNKIPKGYRWICFADIIKKIRSGTTTVPIDIPTQFSILRSSSVRNGRIDFDDVRYVKLNAVIKEDDFVNPGDLLFTRLNGSIEFVGNCAMVPLNAPKETVYPDRLFKVALVDFRYAKYIQYFFSSPVARRKLERVAKSTAGHMRISIPDIREMQIPFCDFEEQQKVVEEIESRLSIADKLEETITNSLQQAEALRQSILKKAFEGKLSY